MIPLCISQRRKKGQERQKNEEEEIENSCYSFMPSIIKRSVDKRTTVDQKLNMHSFALHFKSKKEK